MKKTKTKSKKPQVPLTAPKEKLPQVNVGGENDYDDEELDDYEPSEVLEEETGNEETYPLSGFQDQISSIVEEYYENEDINEFIEAYSALSLSDSVVDLGILTSKALINISLDRTDAERELTSSLLLSLVDSKILKRTDVKEALVSLLSNLRDLKVDVPDSPTILAKYIARLVGDAILDESFLKGINQKVANKVQSLLLPGELHLIWGKGSGHAPVQMLVNQMNRIIVEYIHSGNQKDVTKGIHDLKVPHFHHEFVFLSLLKALENKKEYAEKIMDLHKHLSDCQIISKTQIEEGYQRVMDNINEIRNRFENVYADFADILLGTKERGIISQRMIDEMPNQARKRQASLSNAQ